MEHCIDLYLDGKSLLGYEYFGSHLLKSGTIFRVYAPDALKVSLVGDFNQWKGSHHMEYRDDGVWSLFVKKVKEGVKYKYKITTKNGNVVYRSDPYATFSEVRPNNASVVYDINKYDFNDSDYINKRDKRFEQPLLIYEMHVGSWFMNKQMYRDGVQSFFSFDKLSQKLVKYLKKMNYTHVEFMPLQEHPDDASWGYLGTGYFSATSRYGKPDELMKLVDVLHQNNIGIIIDFVPCHFVSDEHGLRNFDGSELYQRELLSEWDSCYFDYSKGHVCSFMLSAITFWIEKFHIDGIRFDAISHLIYNLGNIEYGLYSDGIKFIQTMTSMIHTKYPTVMLIAEDSSSYPGVTHSVLDGGLGFDYKWDLGWMNDTLKYLSLDPLHRKSNHQLITFSMAYFYNEKYILPFSHDEVVHSKKTIIDKIYGTYYEKFAQARTLYMYMLFHPGKKLNFMTNDLAEFKEFDHEVAISWSLLKYPIHDAFNHYISDLQSIIKQYPSLYYDYHLNNFNWLVVDDDNQSVFVFERMYKKEVIIVVLNFTSNRHTNYEIPLNNVGKYIEVINSDSLPYNGKGFINNNILTNTTTNRLKVNIAPFSSFVLVRQKGE